MRIQPTAGGVPMAELQPLKDAGLGKIAEAPGSTAALSVKVTGERPQPAMAEVEAAVAELSKHPAFTNYSLSIEVLESHRFVIKIIDLESGEIIRQIPPEELIEALRNPEDGPRLLLDKKV
jgi:flagellar protein FlaG